MTIIDMFLLIIKDWIVWSIIIVQTMFNIINCTNTVNEGSVNWSITYNSLKDGKAIKFNIKAGVIVQANFRNIPWLSNEYLINNLFFTKWLKRIKVSLLNIRWILRKRSILGRSFCLLRSILGRSFCLLRRNLWRSIRRFTPQRYIS